MARSSEEERRARRRKRLTRGLLLGAAAFGLPALYNTWVARRTARLVLPVWGQPRTLETSLGEIAYRRLGPHSAGERTVVLLHSLGPGHSSAHWRPVAQRLAVERAVLAIDWPGWGASARRRAVYSPENLASAVSEIVGRLVGENRTVLVAAGLAAAPAVLAAARPASGVDSLTLVCPRGGSADRLTNRDQILRGLLALPVLGTSAVHLATSRRVLESQLEQAFADPRRIPPELLDEHERFSHLSGSRYPLGAYLSGALERNVLDQWSAFAGDAHLVWGRDSRTPEIAQADLWLQRREASLSVVESAGSLPHLERPNQVADLLERHLDPTQ